MRNPGTLSGASPGQGARRGCSGAPENGSVPIAPVAGPAADEPCRGMRSSHAWAAVTHGGPRAAATTGRAALLRPGHGNPATRALSPPGQAAESPDPLEAALQRTSEIRTARAGEPLLRAGGPRATPTRVCCGWDSVAGDCSHSHSKSLRSGAGAAAEAPAGLSRAQPGTFATSPAPARPPTPAPPWDPLFRPYLSAAH